jgi:hypothetical protein
MEHPASINQMTEVRRQKSEVRKQRTEDRRQNYFSLSPTLCALYPAPPIAQALVILIFDRIP